MQENDNLPPCRHAQSQGLLQYKKVMLIHSFLRLEHRKVSKTSRSVGADPQGEFARGTADGLVDVGEPGARVDVEAIGEMDIGVGFESHGGGNV